MEVRFYNIGEIEDKDLKFAVICSVYKNKWIYVRHRDRVTWEVPGGHREENEDIKVTASRELIEETGAKKFKIVQVCEYGVRRGNDISYGRLCYADVSELGELPDFEIREIKLFNGLPDRLTYPEIQPYLYERVVQFLMVAV